MKKILILIITVILISIGIVSCLYINNRNKETQKEVIKNSKIEEEMPMDPDKEIEVITLIFQ